MHRPQALALALALAAPLAAALALDPAPLAAQVTADLHTGQRPRVVAPDEGHRRILPDGRAILLKVGPSTTGAGYLFLGAEDLPPGSSIPRHRHELDEEILVVHRGTVEVQLNDSTHSAPAGSVVYLPPRTWVRVRNAAPADTATIMFVFPRGAVERCFQFIGRGEAETAADARRPPPEAEAAEERHSCQMTYR
jgi:mannose-6-phosphate isomerase-like protein (cupin superfamily)